MPRTRALAIALALIMVLSVVSATAGAVPLGPRGPADAATVEAGPAGDAAPAATVSTAAASGNVSRVAFDYAQFGGNLNVEVNGDRVFDITEFGAAPPDGIDGATIGGASVSVSTNGSTGHVEITGDIGSFSLGGQELYVDNVEFGPASNPNATVTFRNPSPFQSSYVVGDQFSSQGVPITVESYVFEDGTVSQQGTGRWVNGTNAGGPIPEFFPSNVNLRFNVSAVAGEDGGEGEDETVITGFHRPQIDGKLFGHNGQDLPEGAAPEWADGANATMTFAALEGDDIQGRVFTKAIGDDLYSGVTIAGSELEQAGEIEALRFQLDRDGDGELSAGDVRLTATPGSGSNINAQSNPSYATLDRLDVYRDGQYVPVDGGPREGFGTVASVIDPETGAMSMEARIDRENLDRALDGDGDGSGDGEDINVNLDIEIETDSNRFDLGGDGNDFGVTGQDIGEGWIDELPPLKTKQVDLEFDHLEVTQAVQTRNNDLPLVREKETLARAFVTHNRSDSVEVRVTFEAIAFRSSGIDNLGSKTVTFEAPPGSPDRDDLDDSANLELPSAWTDESSILLKASVEPKSGLVVDTSTGFLRNIGLESIDYKETYDPTVYIVRINEGPKSAPEKPDWSRLFAMSDKFEATFPVANPRFIYLGSGALGPQSGQEDINLLGELIKLKAAIARGDRFSTYPTPDILVGATEDQRSDGVIGLAAVAYPGGRSGTVASWANDPNTFLHEVDHNIGNNTWGRHVADDAEGYGCGADGPDALWNRRFNDDSIHALGWEDGEGLKEPQSFGRTRYHDFMSYCGPGWVSDYRWKMLLDRFQNFTPGETIHPDLQSGSGGSSPAGSSQSMRLVSGRISQDGSATLDPSFQLPGNATGERPQEFADPQAILQLQYTEAIVQRPVKVNFNRSAHGESTDPESLPFALRVPAREQDTLERIRLIDPDTGETLARRSLTDFEVGFAEFNLPQRFERNTSTTVEFDIGTSANRLYKRVLYVPEGEGLERPLSTDRYATPMGTSFTGNSFNASFQGLPGGDAGRFVVLLSDGVRTEAIVSPSFVVPPKPPEVRLDTLRSFNVTYDREAGTPGNRPLEEITPRKLEIRTNAGSPISVTASALDQFGRSLVGRETAEGASTLQWELVDSQGNVVATDTGRQFVGSSGAIGEYVLRVTATDPTSGVTATDSAPVIVGEPPLPDREELRTFRTAIAAVTDGDDEPTGPTLRLEPASGEVMLGRPITYELVFGPADDGVRAYALNLTVANASVAGITDGANAIGGRISNVDVTPEGERVRFEVAGGSGGTGTVTLGTVTLTAREPGTTQLSITDVLVGDRNDTEYAIGSIGTATVTVQPRPEAPDLSGNGEPARDLDGDGLHEDIDGNGDVNILDVSRFLSTFDSPAVQNNPELFDFNGGGGVNILDVADLLGRV